MVRPKEATEVQTLASAIMGLKDKEEDVSQGVGRVLAKSMLGFDTGNGIVAPDGWYLPANRHNPAIIMFFVPPSYSIENGCYLEKLIGICLTALTGPKDYEKMIGIIYNGEKVRVFKCKQGATEEVPNQTELQHKSYYLDLWKE